MARTCGSRSWLYLFLGALFATAAAALLTLGSVLPPSPLVLFCILAGALLAGGAYAVSLLLQVRAANGNVPSKPQEREAARADGRVWNVPLLRNPNFTGRIELLAQLREQLTSGGHAPGGHAVLTQAISGLGGVGKTQLALEYAYRHAADYRVVWWARAEEPAKLASDYAALAEAVDVGLADTADQDLTCEAVRAWLERNAGWLLVLDNAPGPDEVRDYLPLVPRPRDRDKPRGEAGHVIVTSRNPNWGGTARALEVVEFEESESVEFLLKRTGQEDAEAARALADELGDLPLALEQAGAYVEQTGMSLAEYLELFRARREELLKRGKPADYPNSAATTWEVSFEKVEAELPAAADLLRLCAFLGPDDVPLDLLVKHVRDNVAQPPPAGESTGEGACATPLLPEGLAEALADDLARNDAVAALRRYSLVTVGEGGPSVHRLVQAVVRDRLGEEGRRKWAAAAVRVVNAAFPRESHDVRTWTECARLLPHALAAAGHADRLTVVPDARGGLLTRSGLYLAGRAEFAQAQALQERALTAAESAYGPDHPNVAACLSNLGSVLQDQGDLDGARERFERALEIWQAALGAEHPSVATCLNNLALVLRDQGDLDGARERFERALEIDTAALGPDHPAVATDVNNLALVLHAQGDLKGARERCERALEITQKAVGPDHPNVAASLSNLGSVLQDQGDLVGARERFERALQIDLAAYGPEHPEVATDLNNLAGVLHAQGDLAGARKRFERALEITEKALGPNHPDTAIRLNNLAGVLQDEGDLDGARERFERALEIGEKTLPPGHPTIAIRLNNLAGVLQDQGDLDGARERCERALEIDTAAYGPDHPEVATDLNNLAGVLRAQGDLSGARERFERALEILEAKLPPEHPHIRSVRESLEALE